MRILSASLSIVLLFTSGCAVCNRCDEFACECRDSYRGYTAWAQWQPVYAGVGHEADFGSGFQAGYSAVATRGDASAPEVAPRKYQSVFYHSDAGQKQKQAWMDGYTHGVAVAQQDGVNRWSRKQKDDTTAREPIVAKAKPTVPHRAGVRTAMARDGEWKTAENRIQVVDEIRSSPSTLAASGTDDAEEDPPELEDPAQPFAPKFSPSSRGE